MRGFGTTFTFPGGRARSWYVGEDGVKRWADTDSPVDIPTPDAPVEESEE